MWWTEVYATKANAQHAISLMQTYAGTAPVYDRT
jgi:uncharacterized protein YegP (UPF0339 family)